MRTASAGTGAVLAALGVAACGPSMRTLVESDMRFEHCYRIDDDANAPMPQKRACWNEWVSRYAKGQAHNRVDYARERLRVLDMGTVAGPGGLPGAAPGPGAPAATGAIAVDPYAPPPATAPAATAPMGAPSGVGTQALKP